MKPTCVIPDCINPPIARERCERHPEKSFADALASAMYVRRIRPTQLAQLAGLDRKTIWNYLNGRPPRPDMVALLADKLNWPSLAEYDVPPLPPVPALERIASDALAGYQAAVEAFCRACEPVDSICRDSKCQLRPVSPLPFIPMSTRRVA